MYADGYGILNPMIAEFDAGESVTFDGLPSGASCTVTELDDKGAASSTITTQAGDGDPATENGSQAVVELAGDSATVTVTNTFTVGQIAVVKQVDGAGAALHGAGPYRFSVTCGLSDETGDREVYQGDVTLGGGAPLSMVIGNLPTGAACQILESDNAGATSTTLTPADGIVVVGADTTATLTATNTFDVGSVAVTKLVDGAGATTVRRRTVHHLGHLHVPGSDGVRLADRARRRRPVVPDDRQPPHRHQLSVRGDQRRRSHEVIVLPEQRHRRGRQRHHSVLQRDEHVRHRIGPDHEGALRQHRRGRAVHRRSHAALRQEARGWCGAVRCRSAAGSR